LVPHTIVVHFAVALLVTSVLADVLALLGDEDDLRIVGAWTLVFGALAAAFAVLSGLAAADAAAPSGIAETVVLRHRNFAFATTASVLPPAAWRFALKGRLPDRAAGLYWLFVFVGLGLLVITGWYGGAAVYRHGVGVLAS
jgi:uncharacterized membrane protein